MTKIEFLEKMKKTKAQQPDAVDLKMLLDIEKENDGTYIGWEDYKLEREFTGQIALRVAKDLHKEAYVLAKQQGLSLNQFCSFCLTRQITQMLGAK